MNTDIPYDIYVLLMAEYDRYKYISAHDQAIKNNNIRIDTLRAMSFDCAFELTKIQTTIVSKEIKSDNKHKMFAEQYIVECFVAGILVCTNTFTSLSPVKFGAWSPSSPNLNTLYHTLRKYIVKMDSDYAYTADVLKSQLLTQRKQGRI